VACRFAFVLVLVLGATITFSPPSAVDASSASITYPPTPRASSVDSYYGTVVPDPYRWMERVDDAAVKHWVSLETNFGSGILADLPRREFFKSTILSLKTQPVVYAPQRGTYASVIYRRPAGSQTVELYVVHGTQTRMLLDTGKRWKLPTKFADSQLSPDGRTLAYATEIAGNGWTRWHTLSTTTGQDMPGDVRGVPDWSPIRWAHNSSGFYYGGYGSEAPRPAGTPIGRGYKVYFHRTGTIQASDQVVYERPDRPDLLPWAYQSEDGRYLILGTNSFTPAGANAIVVRHLRGSNRLAATLQPPGSARYHYVANVGSQFYFFTNSGAPRGKLIRIDLSRPRQPVDVIPQQRIILGSVTALGGLFVAHYFRDAVSELAVFGHSGRLLHHIALPGLGSTGDMSGSDDDSIGYYFFSNPTTPRTIYSYDARTNVSSVFSRQRSPFDPSQYVTEEIFATSTGGARIPVFVARRRDLKLDGSAPALLTGYGGFGDIIEPLWQDFSAAWLASGGAYAVACVRGGGEYGESWHQDGMLGNKQHSFDDFAAAANLLIARGFASHATLAAYGYSGGGLLVGVTEVQHPSLFSAVAEEAGPVDVLRSYTYGSEAYMSGEFGSPIASARQFGWLYGYAPLPAIRKGEAYPATLVMTSENDAEISPAHAYKFAATLQWAQSGPKPVVLYVAKAGHAEGQTSTTTLADTEAFLWNYAAFGANTASGR
jgi:prolyl oligopeptidase